MSLYLILIIRKLCKIYEMRKRAVYQEMAQRKIIRMITSPEKINFLFSLVLTLSLLRYLKTSPPLNPMFDVQIWQMIHHWKALVLYFQNLQKIANLQKKSFFAKSSFIVKMFAKKKLSKKWKIIHFWKALDHAISNMQKVLQNFK